MPTATGEALPTSGVSASMADVPDITGHSLEEAEKMLDDVNLKWKLEPVESDEDANKVIDQKPKAGDQVEEYTIITIYYSQGKTNITIPNLVNYTVESAMTELESLGLAVSGKTEVYSDSVEAGKVCGTDPVVGSAVGKGSAVNILVSKGPENKDGKSAEYCWKDRTGCT